jgi:cysteine-rich repeat protein
MVGANGETGGEPEEMGSSAPGSSPPNDSSSAESSDEGDDTGPPAECGNGIVEGDEACDDGRQGSPSCSPACQLRCAPIWERSSEEEGTTFQAVAVGDAGDIWTLEQPDWKEMELSRHSSAGDQLWTAPHARDASFWFHRLAVSSSDVAYLWGRLHFADRSDMFLLEVAPDGTYGAEHTYGEPIAGAQVGVGLAFVDDDRILVSGATMVTTTDRDAWMAMLDAEGAVTWERTFSGVGSETHSMDAGGPIAYAADRVAAIVLEYVGVQHFAHRLLVYDVAAQEPVVNVVLPIDDTGALVHTPVDLVVDEDGDVFVLYQHDVPTSPTYSRWTLFHYGLDGTLEASIDHESVGQSAGTVARRLVADHHGRFVIGGFAYASFELEPWFIVLDGMDLVCSWVGSQRVVAFDLAVDPMGTVVLAGRDWRDGANRSWLAALHGG